MNPVAETLTGWREEDALGKNLTDVFKIISEETKAPLESPVMKVIQEGVIVALANNILLITKDGNEIPIDDSIAPIIDDNKNITGVVLVFRDVTERKRAEKRLQQSLVRLRRTLDETVNALASAVETRDPYTAGHQWRVTELACAIAEEMGLSEERIEGIYVAGLLHDIGKIYIPAEILSKPNGLTENEFNLFKDHPQIGYDIIKKIEFPWPVAKIVLQHHERMDGSGYPQGLSGNDILLEARILGVADVVEAMAPHRPYRPALGVGGALEEILHNKGTLYDPEVVDACLKLFYERGFMFEQKMEAMSSPKAHIKGLRLRGKFSLMKKRPILFSILPGK